MLVLARLPALKTLNFSPVLPKERLNAESYYLGLIAKELATVPAEKDAEEILRGHPRWRELCEEYGEPVVRRVGDVNPNSLAARLVRLVVYRRVGEEEKKSVVLEVPRSASAYTLLGVVSREFKVKPRDCRLVWETEDWMFATAAVADVKETVGDEESCDSGSNSDDDEEEKVRQDRVMREVEIIAGTRSVGTWIEGNEATVRLEVK